MTISTDTIIQQTNNWIQSFVIELQLCPFARREMEKKSIRFQVSQAIDIEAAFMAVVNEIDLLNTHPAIETTCLMFANFVQDFFDYLDFVDMIEAWLSEEKEPDTYQIATFHPDYCFADTAFDDVSNYTNRSPWPMLHILRQDSVEQAIAAYGDTEEIPAKNIRRLKDMGIEAVKKIIAI